MSGKWYHVTEARHHFEVKNFIGAYKHAIKAMELFSPNMEEFADMWWILCQCEVEAKKGSCALDRDMRKCDNLRKRVFCERRRESSSVLITRITDLIFERRFSDATNAIAHAETLEADFNRFDDESCHHYWSTAILKIELKRLRKHQKNLEELIHGLEKKAASIDRQVANAPKFETDQKARLYGFEEKVALLEKQLAVVQKSEIFGYLLTPNLSLLSNNWKETVCALNMTILSMEEQLTKVKKSEASLKATVCDFQNNVASLKDELGKAQELEKTTKESHCAALSSLDAQLSKAKSELREKDCEFIDVINTLRDERDQLLSKLRRAIESEQQQDAFKQVAEIKQPELVKESEQETVRQASIGGLLCAAYSSLAVDAAAGDARQTRDSFAPLVSGVQKEWHKQATQALRDHLVAKLTKTSFVQSDPASIPDQRAAEIKVAHARKVEKEMFEKASDLNDYYHLLAQHIYNAQRVLQEKTQKRMQQQRAVTVRTAEDVSESEGVPAEAEQEDFFDSDERLLILLSQKQFEDEGDVEVPTSGSSSSFEEVGSTNELSDIEVD